MKKGNYWICVAGPADEADLQWGADGPPRQAVRNAMEGMGLNLEVYATGWGVNEKTAAAIRKVWNGQRVYTEVEVKAIALAAIEAIKGQMLSTRAEGCIIGCVGKALLDAGIILDPLIVLPTS